MAEREPTTFVVHGPVYGKARPLFIPPANGRAARAITPKVTRAYAKAIAYSYMAARATPAPWNGPVAIYMTAYMAPRRTVGHDLPGTLARVKPDLDNVLKAVKDALNGIAYRDDVQVCFVLARKLFCDEGRERLEVTVSNLEVTDVA